MSQAKRGTKGMVLMFKDALGKDIVKLHKYNAEKDDQSLSSAFYERVLDIFKQLDDLPIDLPILTETLIGTTVSKFKMCKQQQVSTTARALIKKWKKTAKAAGMPSGSTGAKSTNTTPAKSKPAAVNKTSNATKRASITKPAVSAVATASAPDPPAWKELPKLRKNVCTKMYTILKTSETTLKFKEVPDATIIQFATDIESSINEYGNNDRQKYSEKARSLTFNLKKNVNLCSQILGEGVSPQKLITMTAQQLATTEKLKQMYDVVKKTQDARLLNWEEQNEDKINEMCGIKGELLQASLFTCGRCKSTKTTSTQKQTRSADEPMTVFVFCINCGNRWKC